VTTVSLFRSPSGPQLHHDSSVAEQFRRPGIHRFVRGWSFDGARGCLQDSLLSGSRNQPDLKSEPREFGMGRELNALLSPSTLERGALTTLFPHSQNGEPFRDKVIANLCLAAVVQSTLKHFEAIQGGQPATKRPCFCVGKCPISHMRYWKMIMKPLRGMRPQDIAILLKIVSLGRKAWKTADLATQLYISQSEISQYCTGTGLPDCSMTRRETSTRGRLSDSSSTAFASLYEDSCAHSIPFDAKAIDRLIAPNGTAWLLVMRHACRARRIRISRFGFLRPRAV